MSEIDEPSAGWTARGVSAAVLAGLAALFAFFFLFADRGAAAGASGIWAFVTGTLAFHAVGGFVAGWLLAGAFGRRGVPGWALAVVAGALAMLFAGALGGAIAAVPALLGGGATLTGEAIRIGAAALVTPMALAQAPWLGLLWAAAILVLHLSVARLRR